jgi:hypothetical protein
MKFFVYAIAVLLLVAGHVCAARVTVGFDLNTETGSEPRGAAYVQSVIDSGGVLPVSPATIHPTDVTGGNAIFWAAVIERNPGEINPITLKGVKFTQTSTDSGGAFDYADNYGASNYDGRFWRGFLKGDDGLLWTADDVELTDGNLAADGIVIYGVGVTLTDTATALTYLAAEAPVTFSVRVTAMGGLGNADEFGAGDNTVVIDIPEPLSAVLLGVATVTCWLRPYRYSSTRQ